MFKKVLLGLFIIIATFSACKNNGASPTTEADKAYKAERYFTATTLYRKALGKVAKEQKAEVTYRIAECYTLMNNSKQSAIWYDKSIKAGYTEVEAYKKLGDAYKANETYDLAADQYKIYLETKPNDTIAQNDLKDCKRIVEWIKKPLNFEAFLESGLNTKDIDYAPSYYGKGLIFTSTRESAKGKNLYQRTGKGFTNLYASYKDDKNKWVKAEPLAKDINSKFNEGVSTFDVSSKTLFFTQCNGTKGKEKECKIWATVSDGNDKWSESKPIKMYTLDTTFTFAHPTVSADGNTLYYTSNIPRGYGGYDIYFSKKDGDAWSKPENMGNVINTEFDEEFPFIHPSGTLYFSSNGHNSVGGFDIYYSDFEENAYTEVTNLKYPTNSTSDDISFILDEKKEGGYFASNRLGGKGEDDIYSVINIPVVFTLKGKAINALTNKPLPEATITMIGTDGQELTTSTDKNGDYKFKLSKNSNYDLNASKKRFFGDKGDVTTVGLKESKELVVNFKLSQIPLSEIQLKGILYGLDSADLRPLSQRILDTLIKTLSDNPTFVIELASHTDCRATSEYNDTLSQRRANAAVQYLISKGIEKERLVAKGYGETKLLNKCADGVECTEEEHQANRRTTFAILSEDFVSKNKPKAPAPPKKKTK